MIHSTDEACKTEHHIYMGPNARGMLYIELDKEVTKIVLEKDIVSKPLHSIRELTWNSPGVATWNALRSDMK